MTDPTVSGEEGRGTSRFESGSSPETDHDGWRATSKDRSMPQRAQLLTSMSQASRAFAETMRATAAERKRFAEERERLLWSERAARAEAEASREQLREVLESIGDAFFALDRQWRFTYVNDRAVELTGSSREALIGQSVLEAFSEMFEDGASVLSGETATEFENYSARLARWLRCRVYPSQDGLSVYITDITAFKRFQEERERSLIRERESRAQAEERRRISRDLHDRVAHSMGVVHQSLELYEALKDQNPHAARSKLQLAKSMARKALDFTRNLSAELRHPEVRSSLEAALADLLQDVVPRTVHSSLSIEGDETRIPASTRDQLFLILREAIRNCLQHSGCGRLSVRLDVGSEEIFGFVEDDGRGFEAESPPVSHNGLDSMKERISRVGGTLGISSTPGEGTRVSFSIPLEKPEE